MDLVAVCSGSKKEMECLWGLMLSWYLGTGGKVAFTKKVSHNEQLQLFVLKSICKGFKPVYITV